MSVLRLLHNSEGQVQCQLVFDGRTNFDAGGLIGNFYVETTAQRKNNTCNASMHTVYVSIYERICVRKHCRLRTNSSIIVVDTADLAGIPLFWQDILQEDSDLLRRFSSGLIIHCVLY